MKRTNGKHPHLDVVKVQYQTAWLQLVSVALTVVVAIFGSRGHDNPPVQNHVVNLYPPAAVDSPAVEPVQPPVDEVVGRFPRWVHYHPLK